MTRTLNPELYASLLTQHQPKVIATEEENNAVIALAEELEHRPAQTLEEDALLELLVTLIEKFEALPYAERTSPFNTAASDRGKGY